MINKTVQIIVPVIISILIACGNNKTNQKPPIKTVDKRSYKTVKIGNQEWMAENLGVTTFRNGDKIRQVKDVEAWYMMNHIDSLGKVKPAWCYPDTTIDLEKYGKLYNLKAIRDPRGICPQGWHVPTKKEWISLVESIEGTAIEARYRVGKKLKSKSEWTENGNGTDSLGFNVFPAGFRHESGELHELGDNAYFWTSDSINGNWTPVFKIMNKSSEVDIVEFNTSAGLPCRCVKDN
jgi:uncharacterized protein (TIGR02145 family)